MKRTVHVGNLDPAAESFEYDAAFDVRDLVDVDEIMSEGGLGPNGGLVYCMEYLLQHSEWLKDELDAFGEEDYILLDCPGQIELYSHLPIMRDLSKLILSWDFHAVAVYILDSVFVLEPAKFISGCLLSLSCMLQLGLPHVGVISKCDIADKEAIERILDRESSHDILSDSSAAQRVNPALNKLTRAIGSVIDDFMIVSFVMLDPTDDESIEEVVARIDASCQYGTRTPLHPRTFMVVLIIYMWTRRRRRRAPRIARAGGGGGPRAGRLKRLHSLTMVTLKTFMCSFLPPLPPFDTLYHSSIYTIQ